MTKTSCADYLKDSQIALVSISKLKPYKKNARTHSQKQIQQIADSIRQFGFTNPVLIDDENGIVAGHGRVLAAKHLGMNQVPTICMSHLTKEQIRAYIIADNRLAELAGWDDDILALEILDLSSLDLDFDLEITGFETAEIDLLIDGLNNTDESDPAEDIPEPEEGPSITQLGDLWQLGRQLLFCGDALKRDSYDSLLGKAKADMVITDPPYNVPIDGHVCGLGSIKHKEFAMASGEMSKQEFTDFLKNTCSLLAAYSKNGSLHYIFMDWRHIYELLSAGGAHYTELKNICVWNKQNGGMGTLYRSKHEFIAVFKHGTEAHTNNIQLGKYGRYRTNVWDYAGVNSFGSQQSDLGMHPTVKPVALIADAIKDCTKRGHIVLDPFAGSGSTLIAAEKTGRIARCMEIDPHYCDIIIRRWQKLTGEEAINTHTQTTFSSMEADHV